MSVEAKRSKPFIRVATRGDCLVLAENLREDDLKELQHIVDLPPRDALLIGYHTSDRLYAVEWGGELVAVFGVSGIPGVVGVPWMLATPVLSRIRKSFLREARAVAQAMLSIYGTLENHVWAGNAVHIQWLRWMGFTIEQAAPHGINGEPFHRFYMKDE